MTRLLGKLLVNLGAAALGLWLAARFITGFEVSFIPQEFALLSITLTLFHIFLRPILKLLFGPLILLTLGSALVLINITILFLLDTVSKSLTIQTITALLLGTLVLSVTNLVAHLIFRFK